jgi:hypothetical protein
MQPPAEGRKVNKVERIIHREILGLNLDEVIKSGFNDILANKKNLRLDYVFFVIYAFFDITRVSTVYTFEFMETDDANYRSNKASYSVKEISHGTINIKDIADLQIELKKYAR